MAKSKTKYPGVFSEEKKDKITGKIIKKFYISYRDLTKKQHMELCGQSNRGMTAAKASLIRNDKISGKSIPNKLKREQDLKKKKSKLV